MKKHENIGIGIPEILLPDSKVDMHKWAVVACDQYTSEPEYWAEADRIVGEAPSTLRIVYPEVFLNEANPQARINSINQTMHKYLQEGVLAPYQGMIYLEREAAGKIRKGLMLCIDLEKYDYTKGSTSLVRATEGTIVERIPPRVEIRKDAPIELPHIMVLIDDPENTVLGPLSEAKSKMEVAYDFSLMQDSGHLKGFKVDDQALENSVVSALEGLVDQKTFVSKYDLPDNTPVLLYAMGDGNHSLATAKAIWEKTKKDAGGFEKVKDATTRYALVELTNLHDESLVFEPIHRVMFELKKDILGQMNSFYGDKYSFNKVASLAEMKKDVDTQSGPAHKVGVILEDGFGVIEISNPDTNLPVGSLQIFLDEFMKGGGAKEIDYVHGTEPVARLGKEKRNMGFYLPAMDKNDLFKSVILDGALPRKTFSMGEAEEKRFYLECRRIG